MSMLLKFTRKVFSAFVITYCLALNSELSAAPPAPPPKKEKSFSCLRSTNPVKENSVFNYMPKKISPTRTAA